MFTCKRISFDLYLTLYITITKKLINHLNIRAKTSLKHSEENWDLDVNLGLGNDFLDMIQKAQAPKETKIGSLESSKLKRLSFKRSYQESEISRAPTWCWQGALKPRRTRGTPEQPCMMWGWGAGGSCGGELGSLFLKVSQGKKVFLHLQRHWRDQWGWGALVFFFRINLFIWIGG